VISHQGVRSAAVIPLAVAQHMEGEQACLPWTTMSNSAVRFM
jgi:hypothetical protein